MFSCGKGKKKTYLVLLTGLLFTTATIAGCLNNSPNTGQASSPKAAGIAQSADQSRYSRHHMERGSRLPVVDRTGAVLAADRETVSVYINPFIVPSDRSWVPVLAEILELPPDTITGILDRSEDLVWLREDLTSEQVKRLKSLNLNGLKTTVQAAREYPYGEAAVPVVGFVDHGGIGLDGVEYFYEKLLAPGKCSSDTIKTPNLRLTIEHSVQLAAQKELAAQLQRLSAEKGCMVVMDIRNGEVLALASLPSLDPDNFWEHPETSTVNHALEADVDPAVILPVVGYMAEQRTELESKSRQETGEDPAGRTDGTDRKNSRSRKGRSRCRWQEVAAGLVIWSPWSAEELADLPRYPGLAEDLCTLGFGQPTGIDLPGESTGSMNPAIRYSWNPDAGSGIKASPIQILKAFSDLFSNGSRVYPHVALNAPRTAGVSPAQADQAWLSDELKTRIRRKLSVRRGPSLCSIKWSTADKAPSRKDPAQVSVLGFWPAESPVVSYILCLDGVKRDPRTRRGTLGRTLRIAKQAARIPMTRDPALNEPGFVQASGGPASLETHRKKTASGRNRMPDLSGRTMREAYSILRPLGLDMEITGSGTIRSQYPAPGTSLKGISSCRVECRPLSLM
ncbi:MAG TPA: PASTA domain-containing protein [Thermodesulfobacteriaceae bacterium]|nr:PASTA domain-containing protein [Thermodesulfobacteriaceae bacterium]